jgi:hypothetical protein
MNTVVIGEITLAELYRRDFLGKAAKYGKTCPHIF